MFPTVGGGGKSGSINIYITAMLVLNYHFYHMRTKHNNSPRTCHYPTGFRPDQPAWLYKHTRTHQSLLEKKLPHAALTGSNTVIRLPVHGVSTPKSTGGNFSESAANPQREKGANPNLAG